MSRLFTKGPKNDLAVAVQSVATMVAEQGGNLSNRDTVGHLVSLESLSDDKLETVRHQFDDVKDALRASLESVDGFENLTDVQLAAGAVAAMAAGDLPTYAKTAYTNQTISNEGHVVVEPMRAGPYGKMDYRGEASMEAFDERELRELHAFSVAYNIQAARQNAFGELFYPTVVVTPDQAGLAVSVKRSTVFNAVRHALSGRAMEMKRRHLLEAEADFSILADESTTVVPYVAADNSNLDKFAPAAEIAPWERLIENIPVTTAPLRMGMKIDLLGISQHPGLMQGKLMSIDDNLDARLTLVNTYVKVGNSFLRFNTERLPTASFQAAHEGEMREMTLAFRNNTLTVTPETTAVDGSLPTELDLIRTGKYTVTLTARATGEADVELGNVIVFPGNLEVNQVVNEDGLSISLTSGPGQQIAELFAAAEMKYFDIYATRSNANRRTQGLLVDYMLYTENHLIELGAPISTIAPTSIDRDAAMLTPLVTAARLRNSNNAVTALLNYAAVLKSVAGNATRRVEQIPQIEGIGRFLITPFYEEKEINLPEVINSVTSHERAADVKAVLIDAIRELAYRMHRDTGYQTALDAVTGTAGQMPELRIGTDSVLMQHLDVQGDPRTAGIGFKHTIASTPDRRMNDTIVITFGRSGVTGPDPLSSGVHAYMPELASTLQVSRNGATYKEAMVQPRSRHINTLPAMAVIRVKGLQEVLTSKVKTPALSISPEFAQLLEGHNNTDGTTTP